MLFIFCENYVFPSKSSTGGKKLESFIPKLGEGYEKIFKGNRILSILKIFLNVRFM